MFGACRGRGQDNWRGCVKKFGAVMFANTKYIKPNLIGMGDTFKELGNRGDTGGGAVIFWILQGCKTINTYFQIQSLCQMLRVSSLTLAKPASAQSWAGKMSVIVP